ncbi:hypothetical protein RUE5091_02355 [Ruegeria denitrificans]|uniref:Uncharacterized protein n=1 Tax=Ruegeria denitrificans TaxID=1715692 RepID=A0A0P1IAR8_9RHOB|nr:hypothetical protein [Ruegeria denitrificans]CUK02258.1 hypothetical protein RUE5091_02355 [Ruegeria denitrificans]
MRLFKMFGIGVLVLAPALAQATGFGIRYGFNPGFRAIVTPLDNGNYRVATQGSSAAVAYWCGIGDFAIRTLGLQTSQKIYVSRAYEKQTRTVEFSLSPPEGGNPKKSYSITVSRVGESMSAAGAQSHCYDDFMGFNF